MTAPGVDANKIFEVLVRENHHRILAYAISLGLDRETARDLVQDAFLVAYEKMGSFDPTRSFGAWVRGIVRHKYLHWLAKRRETPIAPALIGEIDSVYAGWDNASVAEADMFERLGHCITRLPDLLQLAVREFYFDGHSCEVIAQATGAEVLTIRKRLQRAREQLVLCLRRAMAEEGL